jgi:RNAse (barnase) inhibitor barstar
MYWQKQLLETDAQWLADHAYRLYRLNCEQWSSDQSALVEIGMALGFPDYYGRNLDAFNDCLSDIEIPVNGGVGIILLRFDHFAKQSPVTAQTLLDIFADNSRSSMLFGRRLVTLVQSDDPRLSFDAVGATPVMWNPREWLNKNRGI